MNRLLYGVLFAVSLAFFAGCSKDDTDPVTPPVTENPTFSTTNVKNDAVYFSFDAKSEVKMWDLFFTKVGPSPEFYLNPARLANTRVTIYNTTETDFAAVTSFNPAELTVDADTSVSGGNWYDYNMSTHQLTSKGLVYIMQTSGDNIVKFKVDSYDNTAGTMTITYAMFNKTATTFGETQTAVVNPAAPGTYFSFSKGAVQNNPNWDIKMTTVLTQPEGSPFPVSFPAVLLNNTNGVLAKSIADREFDAVNATTETGLTTDVTDVYVIGTDWFNYDMATHRVSSKSQPYVLQTISGKRTKFRILNYYNDNNESGYIKLEYTNPQ
jgi:hypothetical protein